jgi:hypothetical protein
MNEVVIAGSRNPVVADYVAHCQRRGRDLAVITTPDVGGLIAGPAERHTADGFSRAVFRKGRACGRVHGAVIFLHGRRLARDRAMLETLIEMAWEGQVGCVCVVSDFRVHLGDRRAAQAEAWLLARLHGAPVRVAVVRPGHVLSRHSRLGRWLRTAGWMLPLVPGRLHGCCVEAEELFAAIDKELATDSAHRQRTYTLLGANRPWRSRLLENNPGRPTRAYAVLGTALAPLAVFRGIAGLVFTLTAKRAESLRPWHVETLRPRSVPELLALYNPYNRRHVKVVGYNNGVVHFGQRYPDKTVVSTVGCNRVARLRDHVGKFDAGVTLRQAMDLLGPRGQEFYVLPNYSYVSLGTGYFIPIHGSSSKFSTVAETIEKVVLYDAALDRFVVARRHDPAFGQYLYNLAADVLLLRLYVRTKDRSAYYVKEQERTDPPGQEILGYFHDNGPSNVELRKAGSRAATVRVFQYYTERAQGDGAALDVPRDRIGRLWDRLEENPLTSYLFHALTRWLAYHVELFLTEEDFPRFWETHRDLPILKIQLRYIRRDGFPNSPFRDRACVSADLFLRKKHKALFDAYLKHTLPAARMNPGKHSM